MDFKNLIPNIPDLTGPTGPNVRVTASTTNMRNEAWTAFVKGRRCDTEPSSNVAFKVTFTEPIYAEYVTFNGEYITSSTVYINGKAIPSPVVENKIYIYKIPLELRSNITSIRIDVYGNGIYNGRYYFYIGEIQAYSSRFRSLVDIHDNLFTFSNGTMNLVAPVNKVTLEDYKKGVGVDNIKVQKDVTDTFKIQILDVKP